MGHTTSDQLLPVISAGTPILPRGDGRLHIGGEPSSALVLTLEPPADAPAVARLLDDLRRPLTRAQLSARARAAGLTMAALSALLQRLVAAGKAEPPAGPDAPHLRVRIHGRGPLAARLADGLAALDIPVVSQTLGPGALHPSRRFDCNLLLLADRLIVDPPVRLALMAARTPHLPVVVHDGVGLVGPLVLPGLSSCLRCADLHRAELDPEWPRLAAQLAVVGVDAAPDDLAVTAALTCQEVAGIARRLRMRDTSPPQTLNHRLQIHSSPAGTTLVAAPPHPRCGCRSVPATLPPRPRVHYSQSRRKDSVERHHTGTGPPQCQAGGTTARHGGASSGRIR
ncbi:hypothetical protein MUG78_01995 [Gordonia alkaliphila]|uniref:hypothetical protein n=1 Tax=Gordonia alkaliphila TaxID=1053547 RepID=UPI001FF3D946|nr:hypothetical protein [Gordonia alkaliphila]MCK0438263.1 hypothetical protein [Gordonia alkaliphila]